MISYKRLAVSAAVILLLILSVFSDGVNHFFSQTAQLFTTPQNTVNPGLAVPAPVPVPASDPDLNQTPFVPGQVLVSARLPKKRESCPSDFNELVPNATAIIQATIVQTESRFLTAQTAARLPLPSPKAQNSKALYSSKDLSSRQRSAITCLYTISVAKGLEQPLADKLNAALKNQKVIVGLNIISKVDLAPNDPSYRNHNWNWNNTGQTIRTVVGTSGADVRAERVWDGITDGRSIVVAVADLGTDWNHPDLSQNIWINTGEVPSNGLDDDKNGYIDDTRGWDFVNNDNNPSDDSSIGHGTHVAGIIGASGNNALGTTGLLWQAALMPLKVGGSTGYISLDVLVAAANYAITKNVRVFNASFSGPINNPQFENMVRALDEAEIILVATAGNTGTNNDVLPRYPASYLYGNVIAVAATNNQDQLGTYSSYGPTSVDIAAPGSDILSTIPSINGAATTGLLTGTSMAAPHVTAAIAAMLASMKSTDEVNEHFTAPRVIRDLLIRSADHIRGLAGTSVSGGRLNVPAFIRSAATPFATGDPPPPPTTAGHLFGFEVADYIVDPRRNVGTDYLTCTVNYGDDAPSTVTYDTYLEHKYSRPGTYTVSLSCRNSIGSADASFPVVVHDAVNIIRAIYKLSNGRLVVKATSSEQDGAATLVAHLIDVDGRETGVLTMSPIRRPDAMGKEKYLFHKGRTALGEIEENQIGASVKGVVATSPSFGGSSFYVEVKKKSPPP